MSEELDEIASSLEIEGDLDESQTERDPRHFSPASSRAHAKRDTSGKMKYNPEELHKTLKEKEEKVKSRDISEYEDNYTAALGLPSIFNDSSKLPRMPDEELNFLKDQKRALLVAAKENIIEHSARRVDLFFYTLIAYYKSQTIPTQGQTRLQHGKGRNKITAAAHSSFFAEYLDESYLSLTDEMHMKVGKGGRGKKKIRRNNILTGTHFMDSLNSTVEVPIFANNFDSTLEGSIQEGKRKGPSKTRREALTIIREVAEGKTDPIKGLDRFLITLHQTLVKDNSDFRIKYLDGNTDSSPQEIRANLLKLIIAGTFTEKFEKNTDPDSEIYGNAKQEYVEMLLRLTPAEKNACRTSSLEKEKIYLKKIIEIKDEIHGSPSHFHPREELREELIAIKKHDKDVKKAREKLLDAEKKAAEARKKYIERHQEITQTLSAEDYIDRLLWELEQPIYPPISKTRIHHRADRKKSESDISQLSHELTIDRPTDIKGASRLSQGADDLFLTSTLSSEEEETTHYEEQLKTYRPTKEEKKQGHKGSHTTPRTHRSKSFGWTDSRHEPTSLFTTTQELTTSTSLISSSSSSLPSSQPPKMKKSTHPGMSKNESKTTAKEDPRPPRRKKSTHPGMFLHNDKEIATDDEIEHELDIITQKIKEKVIIRDESDEEEDEEFSSSPSTPRL